MTDGIGASTYWKTTTAPYGVGAATAGDANHVHMTQPLPSTLRSTSGPSHRGGHRGRQRRDRRRRRPRRRELRRRAARRRPRRRRREPGLARAESWPAATHRPSTRSSSRLRSPSPTRLRRRVLHRGGPRVARQRHARRTPVAYSVTLECSSQTVPDLEETVAHEYVEAATDPYPSTNTLAYVGFDPNHLSWDIYTGFADDCQRVPTGQARTTRRPRRSRTGSRASGRTRTRPQATTRARRSRPAPTRG